MRRITNLMMVLLMVAACVSCSSNEDDAINEYMNRKAQNEATLNGGQTIWADSLGLDSIWNEASEVETRSAGTHTYYLYSSSPTGRVSIAFEKYFKLRYPQVREIWVGVTAYPFQGRGAIHACRDGKTFCYEFKFLATAKEGGAAAMVDVTSWARRYGCRVLLASYYNSSISLEQ